MKYSTAAFKLCTHGFIEVPFELWEVVGVVGILHFHWLVRQFGIISISFTIVRVWLILIRVHVVFLCSSHALSLCLGVLARLEILVPVCKKPGQSVK